MAVGQGTSGNFADPLGATELTQQLELCGVDARPYWEAVETAHVAYLEKCAALRSGQMEKVQTDFRSQYSTVGIVASAAEVERWTRAYLTARRALAALDAELFTATSVAAPEGDRRGIESARAARERDALRVGIARGLAAMTMLADVGVVFRSIESENPEAKEIRASCEGPLREYDARHGRILREFSDAAVAAMPELAREMEGGPRVDPETATDEELAAHVAKSAAAQARVFEEALRIALALPGSNEKAYRAVHSSLEQRDPAWARRFRTEFIVTAYPSIREPVTFTVEEVATRALRLKALGELERAAIRQQYAAWCGRDDSIVDEQIREENRSLAAMTAMGGVDQEASARYHAGFEQLTSRRTASAQSAIESIKAIAGPRFAELTAKLGTHEESEYFLAEGEARLSEGPKAPAATEAAAAEPVVREPAAAAGEVLFRGVLMGVEWMEHITRSLGLSPAQRAILDALQRDYADAWARDITPAASLLESVSKLELRSGGGEGIEAQQAFDEDAVAAMVTAAAAVRGDQRELDRSFFEDLEAALGDPSKGAVLALLRCARECGERVPELDQVFDRRSGGEENANIAYAIVSVKLPPEECAKAAAALAPRLDGLVRAANSVDSALASLWRDRVTWTLMRATLAKLNDANLWSEAQREAKRRKDAVMGAGLSSTSAKAKAQREALGVALPILSESARAAVEGVYLRDAYFSAYGESEPVWEMLQRALKLADLTEEQRTSLALGRDEYRKRREVAVQDMVKVMQRDGSDPARESPDHAAKETWAHMDDLQRFAFARDAARDQLLVRLKSVLTAEQVRAAGIE